MTTNLQLAKKNLLEGGYTLSLFDGKEYIVSYDRGVKPLLDLYHSKRDFCKFSVADKVIGKAASYLYVLLNVKEIYTNLISDMALEVLKRFNINVYYQDKCDKILNRTKTGFCPMETAVEDEKEPMIAYQKIIEKLKTM